VSRGSAECGQRRRAPCTGAGAAVTYTRGSGGQPGSTGFLPLGRVAVTPEAVPPRAARTSEVASGCRRPHRADTHQPREYPAGSAGRRGGGPAAAGRDRRGPGSEAQIRAVVVRGSETAPEAGSRAGLRERAQGPP
jgi:hypothetical protein